MGKFLHLLTTGAGPRSPGCKLQSPREALEEHTHSKTGYATGLPLTWEEPEQIVFGGALSMNQVDYKTYCKIHGPI